MSSVAPARNHGPLGDAARRFLEGPPKKLLIGDKWLDARSGKTFGAINPATEDVIGRAAEGDAADVDAAVAAARRCSKLRTSWRGTPRSSRNSKR